MNKIASCWSKKDLRYKYDDVTEYLLRVKKKIDQIYIIDHKIYLNNQQFKLLSILKDLYFLINNNY